MKIRTNWAVTIAISLSFIILGATPSVIDKTYQGTNLIVHAIENHKAILVAPEKVVADVEKAILPGKKKEAIPTPSKKKVPSRYVAQKGNDDIAGEVVVEEVIEEIVEEIEIIEPTPTPQITPLATPTRGGNRPSGRRTTTGSGSTVPTGSGSVIPTPTVVPTPVPTPTPTPTPTPVPSGTVCFFIDPYYGGDSFCVTSGSANMPAGWDNQLSSVTVTGTVSVNLYKDENQAGGVLNRAVDTPRLVVHGFNGVVSSYEIIVP